MGHVGHQHVAGALLGGRIGGVGELEMIEPFEIEAQHPARAVDLEGVRVAAADPEPRRFERADAAVLEPQQRDERIVNGTAGNEGARQRDALGDRAVEIERGVEQVREEIVRDARPGLCRIHLPGAVARSVGSPLLPVGGVVVKDRAEPSRLDQPARVGNRGHAPVVVPDHRRHAARGLGHRLRVVERQRHRLFAEDDLARLRRGNRGLGVEVIRQRDVDRVDVAAIDGGAPVGGGALPSPALRHGRELDGIAAAQQRPPHG